MKTRLLLLTTLLLMIVGCSKSVEESTLINKDGLMYLPDSDTPYTGEVFFIYDTGEKEYQGTYENGLLIEYSYLNKDGTVKEPINFETTLIEKDGVYYTKDTNKPYSGTVFSLYNNGKTNIEGSLKNGIVDGNWIKYYEDGKKMLVGNYRDGIEEGKFVETGYFEEYYIQREVNFLEGKVSGEYNEFLFTQIEGEDEQKKLVTTVRFKDGKSVGKIKIVSYDLKSEEEYDVSEGIEPSEFDLYYVKKIPFIDRKINESINYEVRWW